MAFVREIVPEEYRGMLESLGLTDVRIGSQSWTADKDRNIYLWMTRFPDRDDYSADYVLLWQDQVIKINITTVAGISDPERDEVTGDLLKGLTAKNINHIFIPAVLRNKKEQVVEVVKEAFEYLDHRYDVEFRSIAEPEVR